MCVEARPQHLVAGAAAAALLRAGEAGWEGRASARAARPCLQSLPAVQHLTRVSCSRWGSKSKDNHD